MSKTLAVILFISIFVLYINAQGAPTDYFSKLLAEKDPTCQTGAPRVRNAWKNLSQEKQQAYVKTVLKMKKLNLALKQGYTTLSSVYNGFVGIHYEVWNAYAWHGTAIFVPVHKWYLFNFESALIYVAATYYSSLGFSREIACSMTLPYWDWEDDFDTSEDDGVCPYEGVTYGSKVLESDDFGSQGATSVGTTYFVNDGVFSNTLDWPLAYPVKAKSTDTATAAARLKRQFNCKLYALKTSAATIFDYLSYYQQYYYFTSWLEGVPHGWVHMNIGFSMSSMYSPDDPLFFLHHCNIDRIYAIWQDCWDYEQVDKNSITLDHYDPGTWFPYNGRTGLTYDMGTDKVMPYVFSASGSGSAAKPVYSTVFGTEKEWPTPRDMWSSINGFKGLNVRYGPDKLVQTFGNVCDQYCGNTEWRLVNFGGEYKKAPPPPVAEDNPTTDGSTPTDGSTGPTDGSTAGPTDGSTGPTDGSTGPTKKRGSIVYAGSLDPHLTERIETERNSGKSMRDIIHDIAMEDCLMSPKTVIDDKLLAWIRMNGLHISQFDTMCDKVSERADHETSTLNEHARRPDSRVQNIDQQDQQQMAPMWVIVVATIGCTLLLVAIISGIVFYLRKRNDVGSNPYIEMRE